MIKWHRGIFERRSIHYATPRLEKGWVSTDRVFALYKSGNCWVIYHAKTGQTAGSVQGLEYAKTLVERFCNVRSLQWWSMLTREAVDEPTVEVKDVLMECNRIRAGIKS